MTTERPAVHIEPLLSHQPPAEGSRHASLPQALRNAYGSDLSIPLHNDRPTLIANFVTTLDGVVSFHTPDAMGGGEVSGFFEPDRLVMGLLRSFSDAVLVGAGTLRAAPKHVWKPAHVHRPSAADYAAVRDQLRLAPEPTTVLVTAGGDVDLDHPGLSDPTVPVTIITTDRGQAALRRQAPLASHVEVITAGSEHVDPKAVVEILRDRGMRLVLTEGGPHLFGQLVGARLIDEVFLTIAPQIAGRSSETPRLALVEGTAFTPDTAPWPELIDARKSGDHLFLRYRFKEISE